MEYLYCHFRLVFLSVGDVFLLSGAERLALAFFYEVLDLMSDA